MVAGLPSSGFAHISQFWFFISWELCLHLASLFHNLVFILCNSKKQLWIVKYNYAITSFLSFYPFLLFIWTIFDDLFFNPVLETGFHKNTNKNKIIFLTPLAVTFFCLMQKLWCFSQKARLNIWYHFASEVNILIYECVDLCIVENKSKILKLKI